MFSAQMGAAPGGDIKQATAVLKQRLGARPGANQAWMAKQAGGGGQVGQAGRQDLSGASPDGTIMGRGGNVQQLGKAAMARLPQSAPPPPGGVGSEEAIQAFAAQNPGISEDFIRNAAGQGQAPGAPQSMTRPAQLQGQQLADAMARRGMPAGQGFISQEVSSPNRMTPEQMAVAQPMGVGPDGRITRQAVPMERGGIGMQVDPMPLETGEMGGQATDLMSRLQGMQQAGAPGVAAGGQNPALQALRMRKTMGAGPGRNNPYSSLVSSALSGGLAGGGMPSY